jgi:hypothetical protein
MGSLTSNGNLQPLSLSSSSLFRAPTVTGLVDWSAVKIRTDSSVQKALPALDLDLESQLDADSEKYLELYYLHFHHRWPLFHRPSLNEEAPGIIVSSSMAMIGAWLEGSLEAKKHALDSHEKLVTNITSQLVRIRPQIGQNRVH